MVFVLVHSPLVGPGTWTPVAQELERRGMQAVVPSLLAAADAPPPQWHQCVEIVRAATRMVASPIVLVGHSGGGLLLPAMASAVAPDVSHFIFVDSAYRRRRARLHSRRHSSSSNSVRSRSTASCALGRAGGVKTR